MRMILSASIPLRDKQSVGRGTWRHPVLGRMIMIDAGADATQIASRRLALRRQRLQDPACNAPESRDSLSPFPPDCSPQSPTVTVVIPALNEARNLPHVFAKLPDGLHEVIIVDGNSVDDTVATARRLRPDVRVVLQNRSGKANALACG